MLIIMTVTMQEAQRAVRALDYMRTDPKLGGYVTFVGVGTLKVMRDDDGIEIELREGESIDDFCVSVGVREGRVPWDLELDREYQGVRVLYMVSGHTRPLQSPVN